MEIIVRFKVGARASICTNFKFAPFINGHPNFKLKVGTAPFINGADLKLGHNIYKITYPMYSTCES